MKYELSKQETVKLPFDGGVDLQMQCKVICRCSVRSHTQSSVKSAFDQGVDLQG